jgi:hypothetical protein
MYQNPWPEPTSANLIVSLSGIPSSPFAQARVEDITYTVTQDVEG